MNSVILDNHSNGNVGDRLKSFIKPNSKLSIVSAYFTIFAYEKLKNELDSIDSLRFLFGEPKFINSLDPTKTNKRDFKIEDDGLVIPLEKKISQKAVARECKDWIQSKVEIKSIVKPNFLHGKLYHIHNPNDVSEAIMGSSNFTVNGLGLGGNSNIELNMVIPDKRDLEELINWFNNLWENSDGLVEDVKDQVIAYLEKLYVENEPEFIYFKTLYHIFHRFIEDQDKGGLLEENIGFFESQVWNMLYDFQRDGVKGAINKIMTHNGCIIADSVGLGKTFEALAVIKYFELLNKNVLVLTPKKLRENWTVYRLNDDRNPFIKDRLRYDVLNHTDLSRDSGKSGDIDLSTIKWEIYDLVVIDESHNFRNNAKGKRDDDGNLKRKSRYEKLMTEIIQAGVKTKVLLLSATPVNNNLKDLRNQIYIITGNDDSALYEKTNIKDISQTLKNAQNNFSRWADSQNENRTVKDLLERLDSSFFKLLDTLTIARSRKHILNYYDINSIGKFPERLPVISLSPNIDINKKFPSYDKLNKEIAKYRLSLFNPSAYVKDEFKDHYESKSDSAVKEFKQATREHFLIGMMKVNFLKRLESSIESFEISMDRTVNKIDSLIKRIEDYKNNHDGELSSYQPDLFIPDDEDDEELNEVKDNWLVGKKLKFELAHLKLDEWLNDLNEDKDQLNMLYNNAYSVTPERDEKLKVLKNLIKKKVNNSFNNSNKKVIIFTAFADTAYYLYDCLEDFVNKDLKIHIAVVAGGTRENKTTFKPKGFRFNSDFNSILTNFSPISKNRAKIKSMPQEGEINILIATDCISEGQNLQDCDYLINYDIHWNPVRIIQRFGRIDRLGSINDSIQLVNFWPTDDLNNYINLKERVQARMALVDITATGEENILDPDQLKDLIEDDLKFRNKQLKRLQKEVLDLEDLDQNISLSEFTLDDFRIELTNYIEQNKKKLEEAPFGLYAVVPAPASTKKEQLDLLEKPSEQIIKPGVIFCLKQKGDTDGNEEVNPLQPYFLVYIRDDGTVRFNYTHAKQILEIFRLLCQGKTQPYEELCNLFNDETGNGANMDFYNSLLEKAVSEIVTVFGKKARARLQSGRDGILIPPSKQVSDSNNFELITWLVIK